MKTDIHYRYLAPMYNFHIGEDVEMKNFDILKNRDNVKIKQLDRDINDANIRFSGQEVHD